MIALGYHLERIIAGSLGCGCLVLSFYQLVLSARKLKTKQSEEAKFKLCVNLLCTFALLFVIPRWVDSGNVFGLVPRALYLISEVLSAALVVGALFCILHISILNFFRVSQMDYRPTFSQFSRIAMGFILISTMFSVFAQLIGESRASGAVHYCTILISLIILMVPFNSDYGQIAETLSSKEISNKPREDTMDTSTQTGELEPQDEIQKTSIPKSSTNSSLNSKDSLFIEKLKKDLRRFRLLALIMILLKITFTLISFLSAIGFGIVASKDYYTPDVIVFGVIFITFLLTIWKQDSYEYYDQIAEKLPESEKRDSRLEEFEFQMEIYDEDNLQPDSDIIEPDPLDSLVKKLESQSRAQITEELEAFYERRKKKECNTICDKNGNQQHQPDPKNLDDSASSEKP